MKTNWNRWFKPKATKNLTESVDLYFVELEKRLEDSKVELEKRNEENKQQLSKIDQAFAINFDNEFGYLSDARLDDLGRTFRRFKLEKKYDITFTAYVKAVISGRWKEFVDAHEPPPSTILPKYKLRRALVQESNGKRTIPILGLFTLFLFLILVVILLNYILK